MSDWLLHGLNLIQAHQVGDVATLAVALVAVRVLVGRAAAATARMDPASPARMRWAWVAAAMPGLAFLALTPTMVHSWNVRTMVSATCAAHCVGLAALLIGTAGAAIGRMWWHSRAAGRMMRISTEPSPRLARIATAVSIPVREIPTDALVLAVARVCRPCVMVSRGAMAHLKDEQLHAALLHEKAHVRRRETLRTAAAAFLNSCTPLAAPAAFEAYVLAREFAADRAAARESNPVTLAEALVAFTRASISPQGMVPLVQPKNVLARIELLLGERDERDDAKAAGGAQALAAVLLASAAVTAALPTVMKTVRVVLCSHGG